MDKTRSALETIGNGLYIALHYIIFYGRKYPLAPALYLLFFVWFFFLRRSSLPPAPPAYTSSPSFNLTRNNNPYSSAPAPAPAPTPTPIIQAAQVSAFQSGDRIILRWNRPVNSQEIYTDGNRVNVRCQPRECQIKINDRPKLIYTKWSESGQTFEKSFSF